MSFAAPLLMSGWANEPEKTMDMCSFRRKYFKHSGKMKARGYAVEEIAEITGLSVEEIEAL